MEGQAATNRGMGDVRAEPASVGAAPVTTVEAPPFAKLYADYFDFVWTTARRLGVPDGMLEDVVQEVFAIVHRKLDGFEGRSSFRTWLFAIARNVCREARRSARRKAKLSPTGAPCDPDELEAREDERPDQVAERRAQNQVLHQILDALDDDKREVFVLAEMEQFTAPEIAEALSINLNTVYSRLRLAREAFAEAAARYRLREKGARG